MPTPRRSSSRGRSSRRSSARSTGSRQRRAPDNHVTIFVFGLLGLIFCPILAVVAWVMGTNYEAECRRAGVMPEGLGTAGRIMGIIGTVLMALGGLLYALVLAGVLTALGSV